MRGFPVNNDDGILITVQYCGARKTTRDYSMITVAMSRYSRLQCIVVDTSYDSTFVVNEIVREWHSSSRLKIVLHDPIGTGDRSACLLQRRVAFVGLSVRSLALRALYKKFGPVSLDAVVPTYLIQCHEFMTLSRISRHNVQGLMIQEIWPFLSSSLSTY
jgi:hypothetical protein